MYSQHVSLLALAGVAQAHMSLWYPGPLGGATTANRFSTVVDPELNFPLGCCGSSGTGPSPGLCRGHLDLFDVEDAQLTWQPGEDAYFQLSDYTYTQGAAGSTHYGGSCQVGFSTDRGETWKVAASYNGNCPLRGADGSPEVQTFDFKVPTGMPEGKALFAWIWLNREHESFMNCAAVQIGSGGGSGGGGGGGGNVTTPATPTNEPQPSVSATKPTDGNDDGETEGDDENGVPVVAVPETGSGPIIDEDENKEPTTKVPTETVPEETEEEPLPVENDDSMDDDETINDGKGKSDRWNLRHSHHRRNTYKVIHDHKCKTSSKRAECICTSSTSCTPATRAIAERQAIRLARADAAIARRAEGCAWDSAPSMMVSYYTSDAACAPNAKMNVPESDSFELSWDGCGAVQGDGEYPLQPMQCEMYN